MNPALKIFVLYEVGHIDLVQGYMREKNISPEDARIVPLEFEVEHALKGRGILHESLLSYVPEREEFSGILRSSQAAAHDFKSHPAMAFFKHRDINLAEVFEPMIDLYLQNLFKYIDIFGRIAAKEQIAEFYIPHYLEKLPARGAPLLPYDFLAPAEAARIVGEYKGFPVQVLGDAPKAEERRALSIGVSRMAFAAYNFLIASFVPSRPLKLFVSEYWWHIAPFMEKMDDAELVLMDRKEIRDIPWKQLIKHRIRFQHPSDAVGASARRDIEAQMKLFASKWKDSKEEVRGVFAIVPGVSAWRAIEPALTYLVEHYARRALTDIEGITNTIQREKPDKVLLRASVGGAQHHFFIATQVAHHFGIPSVELQHAGAFIDPRGIDSHLAASYLAAYGTLTGDVISKNGGYARERIRAIGSPRFDHYIEQRKALIGNRDERLKAVGLDPARPVVLFAVPGPGRSLFLFGTYEIASFLRTLRDLKKEMPELQFIFKFRPGNFRVFFQQYIRELFPEDMYITNTTDILSALTLSDVVCTGNSTIIYEAMLTERPVILFPWKKYDTYHLEVYKRLAPLVSNFAELSSLVHLYIDKENSLEIIKKQNTILAENYSFDGKSSDRIVSLLHSPLLPLP